jgi:hypothetical protein
MISLIYIAARVATAAMGASLVLVVWAWLA